VPYTPSEKKTHESSEGTSPSRKHEEKKTNHRRVADEVMSYELYKEQPRNKVILGGSVCANDLCLSGDEGLSTGKKNREFLLKKAQEEFQGMCSGNEWNFASGDIREEGGEIDQIIWRQQSLEEDLGSSLGGDLLSQQLTQDHLHSIGEEKKPYAKEYDQIDEQISDGTSEELEQS